MKLLPLFILLSLSSSLSQLFDQQMIQVPAPPGLGFDNFAQGPSPQRFMQSNTGFELADQASESLENDLSSQAQNLIQENEKKTAELASLRKRAIAQEAASVESAEFKSLKVNNLRVESTIQIGGAFSLEKDGLRVTNETNLYLGNESYSVEKILSNMRFVEKVMSVCGENLEKCSLGTHGEGENANSGRKVEERGRNNMRLKQKNNGRFLETGFNTKKGKKQKQYDVNNELAGNSIDLDTREKEKEVESAVENVLSDEANLSNYGGNNES